MEIRFNESEKSVEVIFNDTGKVFKFNMETEVKLTDFVKYVSDNDKEISITPEKLEEYQAKHSIQYKEAEKLIEYLYKIINAFNESVRTVLAADKPS